MASQSDWLSGKILTSRKQSSFAERQGPMFVVNVGPPDEFMRREICARAGKSPACVLNAMCNSGRFVVVALFLEDLIQLKRLGQSAHWTLA